MTDPRQRSRQSGFGYLMVLFLVAVSSVVALRALENGSTRAQRDREEELLYVGNAYREAIRNYYENSPGTAKEYPPTLEALLLDQRTSTRRRQLRRLYRDPMTGDARWGLVRTDEGQIMGVYSLAKGAPLKRFGLERVLPGSNKAKTYQDWKFVYAIP